ncbi:MAG: class B sortase, partial [Clostridiales bacterium]|nr:class B sortase [Clostridiales bacterium]
ITLDNTEIDHPIVQGENILSYINTDVYGNFALAGSIFLDPANTTDFVDAYCLIYGHHMANHKMFGDLDLYEDEDFFNENTTGSLILPDRSYDLEIFACLLVDASEDAIFSPSQWQTDIDGLLEFTEANATFLHEETIAALREDENPQVLGMSTCSSADDDARTVILARMVPYSQ